MITAFRRLAASRACVRPFSSTPTRSADLAKLILIGRLGKDPEVRHAKNDKEYVVYTVATTNFPSPPPNPDGTRPPSTATWHHITSFNPTANDFLRQLQRGSHVYVEANYELRQPDYNADSDSQDSQQRIFLKHETIRVLRNPPKREDDV